MNCPSSSRIFTLLALVQLAGIGCIAKVHSTVAINVTAQSNANSPIAFDLVEVNDKDLAKQIAQLTAADWFQKRAQIKRDFPQSTVLAVKEWEWVPGQVVPDIKLTMSHKPRLLVAFANYSSAGPHRARLDPAAPVQIVLNEADFQVMPLAGGEK